MFELNRVDYWGKKRELLLHVANKNMNMKFNVFLFCSCTVQKFCLYFLYLLYLICIAFQNEELPSRSCPSLTQNDALSPRWQHIYIVAMDTTSITLCMAFTDLQIKDASLRVMSDEPASIFHTPSRNMIAAVARDRSRKQRWLTQQSMVYQWPG